MKTKITKRKICQCCKQEIRNKSFNSRYCENCSPFLSNYYNRIYRNAKSRFMGKKCCIELITEIQDYFKKACYSKIGDRLMIYKFEVLQYLENKKRNVAKRFADDESD